MVEERRHNDFVSLKEHLESRFQAMDKAIELAKEVNEARLNSLNEWRNQNKDERLHYLDKDIFETKQQLLENRILELQRLVYIGLGGVLVLEILLRFIR